MPIAICMPSMQHDDATGHSVETGVANPLPVEFSDGVSTLAEAAVVGGEAFFTSTGRLVLTAAGNIRATFKNPSGSGVHYRVDSLVVAATNGPAWAALHINPTTGLPVTALRPVNNMSIGHTNASVAELRADTDALTALGGGTDSGSRIGVFTGRTPLDFPGLRIPPGITMGLNVPFTGAAEAEITVYFWEVAI